MHEMKGKLNKDTESGVDQREWCTRKFREIGPTGSNDKRLSKRLNEVLKSEPGPSDSGVDVWD